MGRGCVLRGKDRLEWGRKRKENMNFTLVSTDSGEVKSLGGQRSLIGKLLILSLSQCSFLLVLWFGVDFSPIVGQLINNSPQTTGQLLFTFPTQEEDG